MSETVKKHQPAKRRHRKLTRGFYQIVRQKTTGLTDPHIKLEQRFVELNKLLDAKLRHDFYKPSLSSFDASRGQPWSTEWLSFYLDLLTRFGQNLVRQSMSNAYHLGIEECIPITRRWDAYLDPHLWDSCKSPNPAIADDFVWNMYVILKKPVVCKLINGGSAKSNDLDHLFLITIPPNATQTKALSEEHSSSKSTSDFDPYEFVRFKRDGGSTKSRDCISSHHMTQVFGSKFIPQLLDSLANNLRTSPSEPNLKLIEWTRVENLNLDQLDFKVSFDLSESVKRSSVSPYASRARLSRAPSKGFLFARQKSPSISLNTSQTTDGMRALAATTTTKQSTHLITLRVRFCPVYSFQNILGRGLLTTGDLHSSHARHLFLRPIDYNNQAQTDSHAWQICSRLSDAYVLDKIDLVDRGCRRQAARIVLLFGQIQESLKPCGLTRYVNQKCLQQLCFQRLLCETNETCAGQFEFLFQSKPKPLAWQRLRLLKCIRGMIAQTYQALACGQLVPFNSIETNLIRCHTKADRIELKASSQCVRAWLESNTYLQMILSMALSRLRNMNLNDPGGIHLPSVFENNF